MHGIQDWMGTQWDYPVVCSGELRYFFGEPRSYLEFAKHMIASVLFCEPHPDLMVEKMIFPTIWWIFWVFPYFQTIAKMKVPFSLLASCWTFWLILILTLNDLRWFFSGNSHWTVKYGFVETWTWVDCIFEHQLFWICRSKKRWGFQPAQMGYPGLTVNKIEREKHGRFAHSSITRVTRDVGDIQHS